MLHNAAVIHEVASAFKAIYPPQNGAIPPLIVDPVCVSTSGHTLLQHDAVQTLINDLFPLATLITPNKSEAEFLLCAMRGIQNYDISSLETAIAVARELSHSTDADTSKCNVLLKGGHLTVTVDELTNFVSTISRSGLNMDVEWDRPLGRNMEILHIPIKPDDQLVVDILYDPQTDMTTVFARPRIDTTSTHGTGCTLSAAIACYIAQGFSCTSP